MTRFLFATAVAFVILAAPAGAAELSGKYIEARTCDVYTAPCFANAEMNLTGKHAVMGRFTHERLFDWKRENLPADLGPPIANVRIARGPSPQERCRPCGL